MLEATSGAGRLAGRWQGRCVISASPFGPGGSHRSTWVFVPEHAGKVVIADYSEERNGGFEFGGHGVLAPEAEDECLLWYFFDRDGPAPTGPARGSWSNGRLVLMRRTPRGTGETTFALTPGGFDHIVRFRPEGASHFVTVASGSYTPAGVIW